MNSKLWEIMVTIFLSSKMWKVVITLLTPLILFSGFFYFNTNDLYVWYMMHSKSLFAAVASLFSILALYILAFSSVILGYDNNVHHNVVMEHNLDEDMDMNKLLQFTIKQQVDALGQVKSADKTNSFDFIEHLRSIHQLKDEQSLSIEEYEKLKSLILKKMTKFWNLNDQAIDENTIAQ